MDIPPIDCAEKRVRYFQRVCANHPDDALWAREFRFAEELVHLTRQQPLDAEALRDLLRRLEQEPEARNIGNCAGHEVYMTAKRWAKATPGDWPQDREQRESMGTDLGHRPGVVLAAGAAPDFLVITNKP